MSDGHHSGPWPSQLPTGNFPGTPQATLQRPTTVKVAFWLLVVAAVIPLALVPFTIQIVNDNMGVVLAQSAAQTRRALPPGFYQEMTTIMAPMLWVSAIIGVAIEVLLALGVWTGRNWVRILLTVLIGLNVLSSLLGFAVVLAVPSYIGAMYVRMAPLYAFTFGIGVVKIAGLVLAWLPPSNVFFAMSKAVRGGYLR